LGIKKSEGPLRLRKKKKSSDGKSAEERRAYFNKGDGRKERTFLPLSAEGD